MAQQPQQSGPSQQTITLVVALLASLLVGKFLAAQTELIAKFAKLIAVYGVGDILLLQMRKVARATAVQLQTEVPPMVDQIISEAVAEGIAAGTTASAGGPGEPPEAKIPGWHDPHLSHAEMSAQAIRDDLTGKLNQFGYRITRYADDVYQTVAQSGISQVLGDTTVAAQRKAYADLTSKGVTGFRDSRGRNWSLSAYVEMAVRTAAQRAYNVSHLARMQSLGIDLFTVTDDGHPCPLCAPWQGKVLSAEPDSRADATIADATAAGLFHPNAILGNQEVVPLGAVENGVKAWYSGPSVNVTCASGVKISVSPNHPVLTSTGWLPAKFLREGMQVFSAANGHGTGAPSANEDLNDAPIRVEQVLDSLAALGGRTTVPASRDDLHGDASWVQGEIDVVLADRDLLAILEAHRLHVSDEGFLPRANVKTFASASLRAHHLGLLAVERSVAGALPDFDASSLYAAGDRRAADADGVSDILGALACGVTADDVINVELDWYEGHAFDLQTSQGAYVASSILVHNCRHTLVAYFPGVSQIPAPREWTQEDQQRYDNTQQQRAIERDIRAAKQEVAGAYDAAMRAAAEQKVRAAQKRMRDFLGMTGLNRNTRREQLNLGNR